MLNYARLTCVLTLGAAALSAQVAPTPTVEETTGIVGIADAQTARLNLLNPGIQAPAATGLLCSAAVTFVDANGTVLKNTTLTVAPGKSMSFDIHSDTDLQIVTAGDRREIRATISTPAVVPVTATTATPTAAPACKLVATLEIFDTVTGRTLVTLGRVVAIPPGPSTNP